MTSLVSYFVKSLLLSLSIHKFSFLCTATLALQCSTHHSETYVPLSRRPDITENASDTDGYFNTGDLFQIQDNNCLGFFKRTKDIIIRVGVTISAHEIENMHLEHPKVLDVAAVELDDLISFMKGKGIAAYKLPERMEVVTEIPRNPFGKILEKVLRKDIQKKLALQGELTVCLE